MITEEKIKQPAICIGCVWGRWDGVQHVCHFPSCVKDEFDKEHKRISEEIREFKEGMMNRKFRLINR